MITILFKFGLHQLYMTNIYKYLYIEWKEQGTNAKQLHLLISYLKLTVKIPLTVIFVIRSQNLFFFFFFFFVNVTLLNPFGKSCLRSSKTSMKLILPLQILIRSLVFLETSSWPIYFCVLNITFTPVNFKTKDPLFQVLRSLLKIIESVSMLLQKSGKNFLFI